jgi:hypothetical protein
VYSPRTTRVPHFVESVVKEHLVRYLFESNSVALVDEAFHVVLLCVLEFEMRIISLIKRNIACSSKHGYIAARQVMPTKLIVSLSVAKDYQ